MIEARVEHYEADGRTWFVLWKGTDHIALSYVEAKALHYDLGRELRRVADAKKAEVFQRMAKGYVEEIAE